MTKIIHLVNSSRTALIDDEDFELVSQYKWYLHSNGYATNGTARTNVLSRMHQVIMNAKYIDHKNNNRLDNRRSNLRLATQSQNLANRGKYLDDTTSKYKGVSWNINAGKWRAYIKQNQKQIHLGYFDSEREAAVAYDNAARRLFGEFANTNF